MTSTLDAVTAVTPAVTFDIHEIPFSRKGSWINLSVVTGLHTAAEDVHLVSHINGLHGVLTLTPTVAGVRVETEVQATESLLRWSHDNGVIEAAFDGEDTVRLRGDGIGLTLSDAAATLTPFTGTYFFTDPIDGAAVFTSYETGRRFRVTALAGSVTVQGTEALGHAERAVLVAEDEPWEVVIEQFETSRDPYQPTRSFDEAAHDSGQLFRAYLEAIAPWRRDEFPAVPLAAYVMWSATVAPSGNLRHESVLMSKHWMDQVWSWDHCFNALALLPSGLGAALEQYTVPFTHQTIEGALPDSIGQRAVLYNFVKPPIHGWALDRIRQQSPEAIDPDTLAYLYEGLAQWTRFWLHQRRVPGRAVPYYQHGNDSGWDNSTMFDRDRVIEAPDLAAFLIVQLDVLDRLSRELGRDEDWATERDRLLDALLEDHWSGDAFVAKSAHTGRVSTATSLLNVMPVFAADRLPVDVARRLAERVAEHLTEWGPATELVSSPHYEPDGYWRGPIWAPSTALIEDGLRRGGFDVLADDINARFRRLCEKSGFAENFDAVTGDGLRDRAYTWTASTYLNFAADVVRRGDARLHQHTSAARNA